MVTTLVNVIIAIIGAAFLGSIRPALIETGLQSIGLFIGLYLLLWLVSFVYNRQWFYQQPRIVHLIVYFLKELVMANIKVTYEVLTPKSRLSPAIISVPVDLRNEGEVTLLANMITLTPGTLTIDVSADRRQLYVHTLYTSSGTESFRRKIKNGFEKKIIAIRLQS